MPAPSQYSAGREDVDVTHVGDWHWMVFAANLHWVALVPLQVEPHVAPKPVHFARVVVP
jgi:hypothetical protein